MNKENIFKKYVLDGPEDDIYVYAANRLPEKYFTEYQLANSMRADCFNKLNNEILNSENGALLHGLLLDFEAAVNHFTNLTGNSMFMFSCECTKKEYEHILGKALIQYLVRDY